MTKKKLAEIEKGLWFKQHYELKTHENLVK